MTRNLVRTGSLGTVGWSILIAFAAYAMAFCIFAMTITSVFPVA